ncbi:uncharacterized protein J8A68_001887 [[Candida] subhashii]|uniref:C2H2-type domain-containing protein n=1 Tax=[Candida] subhashii TaxID=561895 RepID=A0A8J5URF7_9ASCO|nr:uncharacterized protein J8A68_001887 [[Candida] subhashii]KAG7664592.1 hypothetical protein J8A68_001887 [[Candida] subhashii]
MDMNPEIDEFTSNLQMFPDQPGNNNNRQNTATFQQGIQSKDSQMQENYDGLYNQFGLQPSDSFLSSKQDSNNSNNNNVIYKSSNNNSHMLSNLESPLGFNDMDIEFNIQPPSQPQTQQHQQQQQQQQQQSIYSQDEANQAMFHSQIQHEQQEEQSTLFPKYEDQNYRPTINMPGAFKTVNDNMDIDNSPPFTIESDLGFERHLDNNSIVTNAQIHNQDSDSLFKNQLSVPQPSNNHLTPENAALSPFDTSSRVSSSHNLPMAPHGNSLFTNGRDFHLFDEDSHSYSHGRLRNGSIDSYYAANVINMQKQFQQQQLQQQQENQMHPLQQQTPQPINMQNKNMFNELSPLTTTTSHTPSVTSLHSTQPSFFSAQQYFSRNSFEQPPSSLHRPSIDAFNTNRTSIDSQQQTPQRQQQRNPKYSFTTSISNYLPFMSDKNQQRSPPNSSSSPQNLINTPPQQPGQPSRHLLRTIFKSTNYGNNSNNNGVAVSELNNMNEMETENDQDMNYVQSSFLQNGGSGGASENHDFLMMSPTKEEPEYETMDNIVTAPKKAKRSKRSLFTRFKAPSKLEPPLEDTTAVQSVEELKTTQDNASSVNSMTGGNVSAQGSMSGTPSIATGSNQLEHTASGGSQRQAIQSQQQQQQPSSQASEPDYAALFENMGKRKNIVSSGYRKPKKPKEESLSVNNSNSTVDKSSILNFGKSSKSRNGSEHSSILQQQQSQQSYNEDDDYESDDHSSSQNMSAVSSNVSSSGHVRASMESETSNSASGITPTTSTLATASKRILGSKLMLKKKSNVKHVNNPKDAFIASLDTPVATMISKGVEVEVDLRSLDLPPDTKIFPTSIINSKNRTRGRKENKEADMVDQSKIYLCNYCSRRFKRHEHLKRHFRSLHTFEKPYDCTICHKKFSRSDNLNQHLKIHKQEEEERQRMQGIEEME